MTKAVEICAAVEQALAAGRSRWRLVYCAGMVAETMIHMGGLVETLARLFLFLGPVSKAG